jgi:hypothetical protein
MANNVRNNSYLRLKHIYPGLRSLFKDEHSPFLCVALCGRNKNPKTNNNCNMPATIVLQRYDRMREVIDVICRRVQRQIPIGVICISIKPLKPRGLITCYNSESKK